MRKATPDRADVRPMLLSRLHQGDSPLIVSVPHAGRHVPDAIALRMTPEAHALPDTDWHVDALYRFAPAPRPRDTPARWRTYAWDRARCCQRRRTAAHRTDRD